MYGNLTRLVQRHFNPCSGLPFWALPVAIKNFKEYYRFSELNLNFCDRRARTVELMEKMPQLLAEMKV
jgi:hypothetical protein